MKHAIAATVILVALTAGAEARGKAPPCTFDRHTVGVTPCGADEPNKPPATTRPPGEQAYWSNGVAATSCSYVPIKVRFPGEAAPRTIKAVGCH